MDLYHVKLHNEEREDLEKKVVINQLAAISPDIKVKNKESKQQHGILNDKNQSTKKPSYWLKQFTALNTFLR